METLIVDDDPAVRSILRRLLLRRGDNVLEAEDGRQAIDQLGARAVDLIITDLAMPRANGFEVLRHVRERTPQIPVIMLTAEGSIRDCVEAMRAGAFNFLTKPFHKDDLEEIIGQAIRARGPRPAAGAAPAVDVSVESGQPQIALIGVSEALRGVIDMIERIAGSSSTVLITGESGTGKEVVARLLHYSSPRVGQPFVAVNCGAIPAGLIESDLFGHVKGAFTGAVDSQPGRFAQANGGTLFLDEIGELPLPLQVRLLRVLQERVITPVGDTRARPVDVRIVAATNRELEVMVEEGQFRQDLFYRLEVLPIRLPALRERREDIPLLADHFLESMNRRFGRHVAMSEQARAILRLYDWPGNVREMENLFERLVVLSRGTPIVDNDLPARMRAAASAPQIASAAASLAGGGIDLVATLSAIESTLIDQALQQAGGNKTRAADLLGISRTTLLDKLKRASGS